MKGLTEELLKYKSGIGENVAVWLHILDMNSRIVFWNNAAENISGYQEREILELEDNSPGKIWDMLFVKEKHIKRMKDFSNEVMANNIILSGINIPIICKDESRRIVSWHANNIKNGEGEIIGLLTIGLDITQQHTAMKKVEEGKNILRALTSQLSLAEEMERKKLAQILHDQVSQRLAVSKMKLGMLKQKCCVEGDEKKLIEETYNDIEQVMEDIRTMTFEISSPLLFSEGLLEAVEDLAEQSLGKHGIQFTCNNVGDSRLISENLRVVLYQVVRELFYNVIKHSKATKVEVMLFVDNRTVSVMVSDNGHGFNLAEIKSSYKEMKHFGLFSIIERIEYLDGNVDIQSDYENGTSITVHVPAESSESNARDKNTDS